MTRESAVELFGIRGVDIWGFGMELVQILLRVGLPASR